MADVESLFDFIHMEIVAYFLNKPGKNIDVSVFTTLKLVVEQLLIKKYALIICVFEKFALQRYESSLLTLALALVSAACSCRMMLFKTLRDLVSALDKD